MQFSHIHCSSITVLTKKCFLTLDVINKLVFQGRPIGTLQQKVRLSDSISRENVYTYVKKFSQCNNCDTGYNVCPLLGLCINKIKRSISKIHFTKIYFTSHLRKGNGTFQICIHVLLYILHVMSMCRPIQPLQHLASKH